MFNIVANDVVESFHMKAICCNSDLRINFAFKNTEVLFAQVIPSSPEFKIDKSIGKSDIMQDYTVCFVQ